MGAKASVLGIDGTVQVGRDGLLPLREPRSIDHSSSRLITDVGYPVRVLCADMSGDPLGHRVQLVHLDLRDMFPGRDDGVRIDLDGKLVDHEKIGHRTRDSNAEDLKEQLKLVHSRTVRGGTTSGL